MVDRNKWLWFYSILAILGLLYLIYLFVWILFNYQSTEIVIRYTYYDSHVEVVGGRIPWRKPDFAAEGVLIRRKDGTMLKLKKMEMWLRDESAQHRLRDVFKALHELGKTK